MEIELATWSLQEKMLDKLMKSLTLLIIDMGSPTTPRASLLAILTVE